MMALCTPVIGRARQNVTVFTLQGLLVRQVSSRASLELPFETNVLAQAPCKASYPVEGKRPLGVWRCWLVPLCDRQGTQVWQFPTRDFYGRETSLYPACIPEAKNEMSPKQVLLGLFFTALK